MYSYGPPHMAGQKQDDQHEHTFSSYLRIRDIALKTCQRRWTIGKSGKRGSGISVPVERQDDDWCVCIYLLNPSTTSKMWHKDNLLNWVLLVWIQIFTIYSSHMGEDMDSCLSLGLKNDMKSREFCPGFEESIFYDDNRYATRLCACMVTCMVTHT